MTLAAAIFASLALFPPPLQDVPAQAPPREPSLLEQGDALMAQRGDLEKAKASLAFYEKALAAGEDAYGANWRLARAEYWVGDHTADSSAKKRILLSGVEHAKKAVALEPGKPEGHYWLGVCYGVYGEAKGVLKSLSLVDDIKEEMARVLEIDPEFDERGADRLLGRLYHELPGLFGGSEKKSLEHLLRSKEAGPWVGLTRIFLADTYLALDQPGKAREELEFVLAMEPHPDLVAETAEEKEMARKRLAGKPFRVKR